MVTIYQQSTEFMANNKLLSAFLLQGYTAAKARTALQPDVLVLPEVVWDTWSPLADALTLTEAVELEFLV